MFVYSSEVRAGIARGDELVALESTIISHGMPYPQNLEVAQRVESLVRREGVTPATIAILRGRVHIGLDFADLEYLAKTGQKVRKVSRRDVADVLAKAGDGATTVATTMMFAEMAGIRLFVTGGIGGVHRGDSWDISADLEEFGRSRVAVVCAGAKSILDLPKTLEVLETKGVPVVGFGCSSFPSFFTRETKPTLKLASRVDSFGEAAKLLEMQIGRVGGKRESSGRNRDTRSRSPGSTSSSTPTGTTLTTGGLVLCNPIPADKQCLEADDAIQTALKEADAKGVKGKDITPFLLARVNELTRGRSLEANIALVENNARVGGAIAAELWKTRQSKSIILGGQTSSSSRSSKSSTTRTTSSNYRSTTTSAATRTRITVIGGATVDYMCRPDKVGPLHTSLPGSVVTRCGGVGRNIAEAISRLGRTTTSATASTPSSQSSTAPCCTLLTAIGDDSAGNAIVADCAAKGIGLHCIRSKTERSARYVAVLDGKGELVSAIADMAVFEDIGKVLKQHQEGQAWSSTLSKKICIVDANVSEEAMSEIRAMANEELWFEPVSTVKALRFFALPACDLMTPNYDELAAILVYYARRRRGPQGASSSSSSSAQALEQKVPPKYSREAAVALLRAFATEIMMDSSKKYANMRVVLTCGADGCFVLGCGDQQNGAGKSSETASPLDKCIQNLWQHKYSLNEVPIMAMAGELNKKVSILHIVSRNPVTSVVNCTGAGDTLIGGLAWAYAYGGLGLIDSVLLGMQAAVWTLGSQAPVSEKLEELVQVESCEDGAYSSSGTNKVVSKL
ncbi:unnamed protein product [Amoebophrya sp. A25]|nr:unnamed protein product [Amoebophrya sp. A25]|eukprot:GSA25T00007924001.1